MTIGRPHRYYRQKAAAAVTNEEEPLAAVWRAKRAALPSCPLPDTYPLLSQLEAAGYESFEDIIGVGLDELIDAGFTRADADAVLAAFGDDMGYTMANGRYANVEDVTLKASGEQVPGTVASTALELGDRTVLRLKLDATAVAGGATLDVTVQTRPNSGVAWRSLGAFAQVVGVSSEYKSFAGCDREVNISSVVANANVTFSVIGEAA